MPPALGPYSAGVRAGGSSPELVVNTTVLVADISEFGVVNELFGEFFPSEPPARMTMQVPLPHGLLISIGCVALVGQVQFLGTLLIARGCLLCGRSGDGGAQRGSLAWALRVGCVRRGRG